MAGKYFSCILILLFPLGGIIRGQDSLIPKKMHLSIHGVESPSTLARKTNKYFLHATDSAKVKFQAGVLEKRMAALGFSEFSLDYFHLKKADLDLYFHRGSYYFIDSLTIEGLRSQEMEDLGFQKMQRRKDPLNKDWIEQQLGLYLKNYMDKGYPFAKFDSLRLNFNPSGKDSFATSLAYRFDAGSLIKVDTVIFEGKKREKDRFVRTVIGIQHGDAFDQSLIDNIPKALNNSIYYKSTGTPKVEFGESTVTIRVPLDQKRAGKFDLLVGILPPREGTTQVQWTGLADFQLVSPFFRSGEIIRFRFDKLPGSSQKMHLEFQQPWIFGSPLHAQVDFNLQKQDTLFLNRQIRVTGKYSFSSSMNFKAWYRNKNSTLLSTKPYELDTSTVPPVLDSKDQLFGIGFSFDNLDYRLSPSRGIFIKADFGIGSKRIIQNPKLSDGIYTGLDLQQPKKEADFEIQFYKLLFKRWVFNAGNKSWILLQDQYFQNDLLQVGGSRSIRGFNENEFFTNFYSLFTLEARFMLEKSSYIFTFADYAWLENKISPDPIIHPFGTGLGMAYETKAGIVSITYAIGKTENIAFQPSRGRIHVGLINQF